MNQPARNASPGSRLPRWQRLALYYLGGVVAASGLFWFGLQLRPDSDDIFSAWLTVERTTTIVHGVMSLAMLVLFGSMLPVHARAGWRSKVNFVSGISMLAALSILALSGAALYYVANEEARQVSVWIHEIIGLASIIVFVIHRRGRAAPTSQGT